MLSTSRNLTAPYNETEIPVYLNSETGMKYRQFHCIECGLLYAERQGDMLYRTSDPDRPEEAAISAEPLLSRCGNCQQQYRLHIEVSVRLELDGIPLYLQPQSIYFATSLSKKLRDMHCLECGKTFHTISERVLMITDNRIPFEWLPLDKPGPFQAVCGFNKCSQTWALMV